MTQTTLNPLIGSISKVHFFRQSYTPISELNPKRYYHKNYLTDAIISLSVLLNVEIYSNTLIAKTRTEHAINIKNQQN